MTMREQKRMEVGQRVRAFGVYTEEGHFWSLDGEVTKLHPPGPMIEIRLDSDSTKLLVHEKQVRRLVARKRR